ncbi:suppressor of lurcher protein 1-like isoform X2 [Ostrea edulis]|uniref:suppressor of lurcher protein 1-like isoform X2 n=2 Tax=Ostrea edulis TaxID=37623 RepID=UPI0024AECCF2|nr:suppressor of lurcher protein 1-like isoform X2 [Ostrea edulis]
MMNDSVLTSLFLLPTFFLSVDLIGPGCECVVYQSTGQPGARNFHSPNYTTAPHYPRGVFCILFSFIGDVNETVEITFIDFNLFPKVNNKCLDFLKLYLNERAEVNEGSVHEYELCGNNADLPQKTFYSRGRSIHMEFHTEGDKVINNTYKGFTGKFSFIDSREFQTTMRQVSRDNNSCSYIDRHHNNSPSKGRFFSPRYPQNYPSRISCSYQFIARPGEIIQLVFLVLQLTGNTSSCSKDEDYIEIYDGVNKTERIAFLCGNKSVPPIKSHSQYLSVYFHSKSNSNRKGFAASYEYLSIETIGSYNQHGQQNQCPAPHECNKNITQNSSPEGTICSPRYSHPYPAGITCTYEFYANPGERVQIIFTHFNLFLSSLGTEERDCKLEDSVSIYIDEKFDEASVMFCGNSLPLQYMSAKNWIRVKFVSLPSSGDKGRSSGFEFQYKFRKDFGITTGTQTIGNYGRPLCEFLFNSTIQKVGNFTSPNYPGVYPSVTHCQYIFRGEPGERVTITLDNFDVGSDECEGQNDHVTFTSFSHEGPDKGFKPICGVMQSLITKRVSDGAYFRVLMSSYDNYEHTGFLGRYEFSPHYNVFAVSTPSPKRRKGSQSSARHVAVVDLISVTFTVLFCLIRNSVIR